MKRPSAKLGGSAEIIWTCVTTPLVLAWFIGGFRFGPRFFVALILLLVAFTAIGFYLLSRKPKPSASVEAFHLQLIALGKELAQIPIEEARRRVRLLMSNTQQFTLTPAEPGCAVPAALPTAVRELLGQYSEIQWMDHGRLGVTCVEPSTTCDGFTTIGFVGEDDDEEMAVRAGDEAVFLFDRFGPACDSFDESDRFSSIYHWFLFEERAVDLASQAAVISTK